MKGESQMIITIEVDTDNPHTVYTRNEDNSISIEYNDIAPDELYLEEIINDFLTWLFLSNLLYYIQKVKENTKPERINAMSKASLETEIRNQVLQTIIDTVNPISDILPISASELALPIVDSEGNEKFAVIKVSIPRGERDGNGGYIPFDGYAAAEEWKLVLADRADKAAKRKEKAERAEKEKERKRAARQVIKKLNKEGLDAMIHEKES